MHWSVYCVNFVHGQIDILDPSPWTDQQQKEFHGGIAHQIRKRLNDIFWAPWTDQQQKELQHPGEQRPSLGSGMHARSSGRAKSRSWPVLVYARRRGRGEAVAGHSGEIRRWRSTHGAEASKGSAWAPQRPPVRGPCVAWPRRRW